MRKIGLIIGALLVSANCYSGTTSLSDGMRSAIEKNSAKQTSSSGDSLSIIYGGQDISRHQIATADETLWAGQASLIG